MRVPLPRLLAAVAVVVLAASGCGSGTSGAAGGGPQRFAPAPPEGMSLCAASEIPAGLDAPADTEHETDTVWGDASLPDPWRGRLVVISEHDGDAFFGHDGARRVRFGGHRADVAPIPVFQGVSSATLGHVVTWHTSPTRVVEVTVRDASAAEAVAMARRVRFTAGRPGLPADALGARTAPIHESSPPASLAGVWTLQYAAGTADDSRLLSVEGVPATRDDLELLRLSSIESRAITVGGRPGIRFTAWSREKGPFGAAWRTDDGQLVTITGLGLSEAQVTAALDSIQPLDADGWSDLARRAGSAGCFSEERASAP